MSKTEGAPVLSGVYAALLTPRRPGTVEVDAAAFLEYLDRVSQHGADGLVLFGSTGEFIHFDTEERMRTVALAVKRSRVPILVNTSHSTLSGTVLLCEQAADAGAAGVLVMPPYFYRYRDAEIEAFYTELTARLEPAIPIYLYSLPFFTNPMSEALMKRLLETGKFSGIKDSSGEWAVFESLSAVRAVRDFSLLVGNEKVYARGLQAAADGIVSGVAAAIPELIAAIGRVPEAAPRLDEFVAWIDRFPSTVAIKQTAEHRRWLSRTLASPLGPKLDADLGTFREWLQDWLPSTLALCAAVRT